MVNVFCVRRWTTVLFHRCHYPRLDGRWRSFFVSSRNASSSSSTTVTAVLQDRVNGQLLQDDPVQRRAAKRLDRLLMALESYNNAPIVEEWHRVQRERIRNERNKDEETADGKDNEESSDRTPADPSATTKPAATIDVPSPSSTGSIIPRIPRGLYLYGSVGTGKSMLMDLFFELSSMQNRGRRVHFHSFMNELQQRIHDVRNVSRNPQKDTNDNSLEKKKVAVDPNDYLGNPVQKVGVQMASETSLLCLDEFQVTDVANAYILTQLLEVLLSLGTVVVATSNQPPGDLSTSYQGSHDVFFDTFVHLLERHCVVHRMDSGVDYRTLLSSLNDESCYYTNLEPHSLNSIVEELQLDLSSDPTAEIVLDLGFRRQLKVMGDGVGRYSFDTLCRDSDYGTLEFRAMARHYDIFVVEDIPILQLDDLRDVDPARRWVTLLDELYEAKVALLCTASAPPHRIFSSVPVGPTIADGSATTSDNTEWTLDSDVLVGDVERVQRDKPHAYRRAASRLTEMTSRQWWDRVLTK